MLCLREVAAPTSSLSSYFCSKRGLDVRLGVGSLLALALLALAGRIGTNIFGLKLTTICSTWILTPFIGPFIYLIIYPVW